MAEEKLDLKVASVNLTRDTAGFLSSMSPYVKITFGD